MSLRTRVFISYSHKDRAWLDRLLVHLRPLERESLVDIWADTRIRPGAKWHDEILAAIDKARVAILLISADFLASNFIVTAELPPLLKAAEYEGATIIPLLISPSRFSRTEGLKEFQAINNPLATLISLPRAKQEAILDRLAAEIERLVNDQHLQGPRIPANATENQSDVPKATSKSASAKREKPAASQPNFRKFLFMHTCLTAKGFFDETLGTITPYDELFGPLDAPHLASAIHIFLHLPDERAIKSAASTEFSAIAAICCSDPVQIAAYYSRAVGRIPANMKFFEREEQILVAAADALESAFVVAVAVPPTFIRAGQKRPEVYYEAMCSIFLVPLIDLHRRLQVKSLHVLVPGVGKCTKKLLDISKRAVGSVYPNGSWSVQVLPPETLALGEVAKEVVWAVKRLYNRDEDHWISYLQRTS